MKKRFAAVLLTLVLLYGLSASADVWAGDYRSGDRGEWESPGVMDEALVITKNVTMRDLPSYDGKTVISVPGGVRLSVINEADGWLLAEYYKDGATYSGWVISDYVVRNPMTIVLRESNVPAYIAPTTSAKKIGSLASYTQLVVLGAYGDFLIVSLRDGAAFISQQALYWTDADLDEYRQADGMGYTVRAIRSTTLRTGPGTQWANAGTLKAGTQLYTLSRFNENGWFVVRRESDGFIAYINGNDLEIR